MTDIRRKRKINGRRSEQAELLLITLTGLSMLTIGLVVGASIKKNNWVANQVEGYNLNVWNDVKLVDESNLVNTIVHSSLT